MHAPVPSLSQDTRLLALIKRKFSLVAFLFPSLVTVNLHRLRKNTDAEIYQIFKKFYLEIKPMLIC